MGTVTETKGVYRQEHNITQLSTSAPPSILLCKDRLKDRLVWIELELFMWKKLVTILLC